MYAYHVVQLFYPDNVTTPDIYYIFIVLNNKIIKTDTSKKSSAKLLGKQK